MSELPRLQGGQLWVQEDFPYCRCYLVYIGGDSWCRIPPPLDGPGCIVITTPDGTEIFSTISMQQLLELRNYTCKGQYYNIMAVEAAREEAES